MHPCPVPRCKGQDGNPVLVVDTEPTCGFHRLKIESAVNDFPRLYEMLGVNLEPGGISANDELKVRTSKTAPIPLNLAARALQEDLLAITRRAVIGFHSRRGLRVDIRLRGREASVLGRQVNFVSRNLGDILNDEVRVGLDVLSTRRSAHNLLGLGLLIHTLPAPCPECDSMALRRKDGDSWVRCHVCGLTFDEDAYGFLVRVLADANPTQPERPRKGQRAKCTANGPRSGLACRMDAEHKCSHVTYTGRYVDWETWR
jgi:hypothetical protein